MRKITSKYEREKNKRMKQFLVGGVLVFIMLISVLGYSFMRNSSNEDNEDENKIIYKEIEFVKQGDFWFADIRGVEFAFKYNPKEVEDIKTNYITKTINDYYNEPLYIYSESSEAETEIYRNLDRIILRGQYACLEDEEAEKCENLPIKTCEDNFIIIKEVEDSESEDIKITQNQSCIFIHGKKEELGKASDKFLYKILGVQ